MPPVTAPSLPIPPPVLQLPWGTVGPGGLVTLTSTAYEFLQLLWSSIQGGGGIIDNGTAGDTSAGITLAQIASMLSEDGRAGRLDGLALGQIAALRQYVDDLVPLLLRPPVLAVPIASSSAVSAVLIASEALAANALVNVWNDAGAFHVRNADATAAITDLHECSGFVPSAYAMGDAVTVQFLGKITGLSLLTPGPAYLGTAGAVTSTPNVTAGQTNQQVGIAVAADTLVFQPMPVTGL